MMSIEPVFTIPKQTGFGSVADEWNKIEQQSPITYCETNFPQTCEEFKAFQNQQYAMFCRKQMDYGPQNIAMGTQLKNEKEKLASLGGIIVRVNDKIQRLVNLILINKREPKNEPVIDSLMDIAVYANIALVVMNDRWGK